MLGMIRRRRVLGVILLVVGPGIMFAAGVTLAVAGIGPTTARTTITSHRTSTVTRTVHVRGHVLSRQGRELVVYVPRVVVRTRTRRIVVPAHVVRIRHTRPGSSAPTHALVTGVGPVPETVTVSVPVTVGGDGAVEPVTVTLPAQTFTKTVTTTVPVTITTTVSLPLDGE